MHRTRRQSASMFAGLRRTGQSTLSALEFFFNHVRVRRAERAEGFDRRFGTDTDGLWQPAGRDDDDARDNNPYEATLASRVRQMLQSLPIAWRDFHFVDLGSGKGRALMVASEFGFPKITGVEIAANLCRSAVENIDRYRALHGRGLQYSVLCIDAADYEFEPAPLVLFLFNPFGERTLRSVMNNLERSLLRNSRDVYVLYLNPLFERAIRSSKSFSRVKASGSRLMPRRRYVIYRSRRGERGNRQPVQARRACG
jgi:SAM-dependent methyltransferase